MWKKWIKKADLASGSCWLRGPDQIVIEAPVTSLSYPDRATSLDGVRVLLHGRPGSLCKAIIQCNARLCEYSLAKDSSLTP